MDRWDPSVIDPDSPQWRQAVSLKRERAFAMLEGEGLTRDEIEQKYDGYHREQGAAFHDCKLREEVTGGHLLGWRQGETLLAYASVCQSELLGDKSRPIYNVLDVCLHPSLTPARCDAILSSLLERAGGAGFERSSLLHPRPVRQRHLLRGRVRQAVVPVAPARTNRGAAMRNTEAEVRQWFRHLYQTLTEDDGSHSLQHCRSLTDCLAIANEKVTDPEFRQAVSDIKEDVAHGHPLSRAMEQSPDAFKPVHVAVIRYGELHGEVDLVLERYLETRK